VFTHCAPDIYFAKVGILGLQKTNFRLVKNNKILGVKNKIVEINFGVYKRRIIMKPETISEKMMYKQPFGLVTNKWLRNRVIF
jgi:hypothetical protein